MKMSLEKKRHKQNKYFKLVNNTSTRTPNTYPLTKYNFKQYQFCFDIEHYYYVFSLNQ